MSRRTGPLVAALAIAATLTLGGCSLVERQPTMTALPTAQVADEVCANGDGAVYAVTLGGVTTRMIAEKVVDVTTADDPIHAIAEQVVHDPSDAQLREQLAEWVRTTCGGS